jgi:membrane associated rhomboid family serine protease
MGLRRDIGGQWYSGGMVVRLIMINAGVFLFLRVFDLLFWLVGVESPNVVQWLSSSSHLPTLITKPWSVVTYMFTHWDLFHIFFNLLILWFIGRIFEDLLGPRRLLGNYILGGFMGLALFIISYNLFPVFQRFSTGMSILGASAGVMGVFIGLAAYRPDLELHLLIFGRVKLKWLALIYVFIDLISIRNEVNSGGHIAHLGGALYGYLAARQLSLGNDWSLGFINGIERLLRPFRGNKTAVPKMRVEKRFARSTVTNDAAFNTARRDKQARVDAILDKISRSGYDSLSKEEKDFLFKASGGS